MTYLASVILLVVSGSYLVALINLESVPIFICFYFLGLITVNIINYVNDRMYNQLLSKREPFSC